jgi:hypothetical protein
MPGTPVGTTASGGRIVSTSPQPSVIDTLPSGDAEAVLQTIPEPLSSSERVAAPKSASSSVPSASAGASAGAAAGVGAAGAASAGRGAVPASRDTTAADTTAADTTNTSDADVPIPEPTRPLGDRPPPTMQVGAASLPAPAPAPEPSAPDTCWRVQVAAVPEEKRAATLRAAAESQLDGHWVVEKEGKLFKVRSRDCSDSAPADALRKRAVADGFSGAFRFRGPRP